MATVTILASNNIGSTNFTVSNIVNAYTDTSSTTYAQLTVSKKNATGTIYFTGFNFSSIPANATINSITIKVKAMVSSTIYITSATAAAYVNGVIRGSSTSYRATSATTYTLNSGSSWNRSDLDTLQICFNAKKSNVNNTAYVRIYGIEVAVDYTEPIVPTEELMIKVNDTWVPAQTIYKKVNGVWVEQTDIESVFDESTNYLPN